jgi:hypothetical protein
MNVIEVDARINMLTEQRNSALNHAVLLAGQVAMLQAELTGLKSQKTNPPPTEGNVPLHIVPPAA